jgi:hypothetical protein
VDFDTESRNVLLLKLAGQMTLHEGRLEGGWVSKGCAENWMSWLGKTGKQGSTANAVLGRAMAIYLSSSAITDKHQLECGDVGSYFRHDEGWLCCVLLCGGVHVRVFSQGWERQVSRRSQAVVRAR